MEFGEYLHQCIIESGVSINNLSKQVNFNRGNLYSVLGGKRKLNVETFWAIASMLKCDSGKMQKLQDLFFAEYYGDTDYKRMNFLFEKLNGYEPEQTAKKPNLSPFNKNPTLSGKEEILSAADYIFSQNCRGKVTVCYSFEMTELDEIVYYYAKHGNFDSYTHFAIPSKLDKDTDDLFDLLSTIRYFYIGVYPFLLEENFPNTVSALPYCIIGSKQAMLFNDRFGLYIENEDFCAAYAEKIVQTLSEYAQKMDIGPKDILKIKDDYTSFYSGETKSFGFVVCFEQFCDLDDFKSILSQNFDAKTINYLSTIAQQHYSTLVEKIKGSGGLSSICSQKGLDKFIEYGMLPNIPYDYQKPMPIANRIKVLKKALEEFKNGNILLADEKKFSIPEKIRIEKSTNHGVLLYAGDYDRRQDYTNFFNIILHNSKTEKTFSQFFDFLINTKSVYDSVVSANLLENRISGLESQLIYEESAT